MNDEIKNNVCNGAFKLSLLEFVSDLRFDFVLFLDSQIASDDLEMFTHLFRIFTFQLFFSLKRIIFLYILADTDNDIVTNYFSRRKNMGLLSLFNYAKESILPHRIKKSF